MSNVLLTISGKPVYIEHDENGQEHIWWTGEFTVDGDGSPRCYGPKGTQPLDYLGNAGVSPNGPWWALATDDGTEYGDPIIQGGSNPCPGYYVSMTAYINGQYYYSDPRRYLDSENILFSVIPSNVRKATVGKCKGCRTKVTDNKTKKSVECVCGDIGPTDHLGEGSVALAEFFGLDGNPKCGGSSDESRFKYEMWPGVPAEGFSLQ
jgi:hypothetical protein